MESAVLAVPPTEGAVFTLRSLRWAIAFVMAFVAFCCDARTRRIPNLVTLPTLLSGLGVALILTGWSGLGDHVASMVLLALPFVLLFAFAGGGAGDAKMMGALGAWLGWHDGIPLLAAVAISGGFLAVLYALAKKRFRRVAANLRMVAYGVGLMAVRSNQGKDTQDFVPGPSAMLAMPYGLAIFVGTAVAAGWVLLCHY